MKNLKNLKIKIYKNNNSLLYANFFKEIILENTNNIIKDIKNPDLIEYLKKEKVLNTKDSDELELWVYKYMNINENILKTECTFWDGWDDEVYETSGLIIDKSKKNRVIISYDKNIYEKVFWFIKGGITMCYYWDKNSEIYIDNENVEDYIDLIDMLKKNNKIEIVLNDIAYKEIKDVKITIGFEIFL
jgi:hypothetical protein